MKYLIKTKHNRRVQNSPIFSFIQRPNVPHGLALPAELIPTIISKHSGPGSTVGIATGYGLDGPVIESRLGVRFSVPVQTGPGAHPASCTMGTGSFPEVKSGRGVTLTPHPLLVPLVMKEYSHTSTPPMGCTTCTEPQCLYKGALYLYFI